MASLQLKLANFQGPLDLLLYLTKKMEVDLYDIPIAEITRQYMNYIRSWQKNNLVIAGEYLVIASTLTAIKSKMLLPTAKEEEVGLNMEEELEKVDPRLELAKQLVEYQNFKEVADVLQRCADKRGFYFTKSPMNIDEYQDGCRELPLDKYTIIDLFLSFQRILTREKEKQPVETVIVQEQMTIEDCVLSIKENLYKNKVSGQDGLYFADLFLTVNAKLVIITTFLALLELIKNNQVCIFQKQSFDPIMITLAGAK